MNYAQAAEDLTSKLGLTSPPVALSFVEAAPEGMQTFEQEVPSACSFWRKAESGVFYASAEKHYNCPIGTMTMGFDMPEEVQQNLMGFVQMMTGNNYITPEEPAHIPTVKAKNSGIVYGPLGQMPTEPDVVLLWLTPRQAMIYNEAVGNSQWRADASPQVLGRPACGALPAALDKSQPQLSMGCAGMRTFTEVSDDRMLVALPGKSLSEFLEALDKTIQANATMQAFYDEHKARFAGA
jgi:uncharacterized protein (DUF169 family)